MIQETEEKALVSQALEARKLAYAPYSGYTVGAALLTADGHRYLGGNIEKRFLRSYELCGAYRLFQGGQRGRTGIYSHCHCRWNIRRGTGGICVSMRYLQTGDAGILQG